MTDYTINDIVEMVEQAQERANTACRAYSEVCRAIGQGELEVPDAVKSNLNGLRLLASEQGSVAAGVLEVLRGKAPE